MHYIVTSRPAPPSTSLTDKQIINSPTVLLQSDNKISYHIESLGPSAHTAGVRIPRSEQSLYKNILKYPPGSVQIRRETFAI